MKRKALKRLSAAFLTAALSVSLLSACGAQGGSGGSVSFTDGTGREISIEKPAEKIVAITASDCEILYAIGAGDTLVGRGTYCDYPEEVFDVAEVQSGMELNVEQITALQPDVVVMGIMDQTPEQVESLESAGLTVVTTNANDIAQTYDNIEMLGELTGHADEAASVVNDMKAQLEKLKNEAAKNGSIKGKTVYFEVSPLVFGLWTAGKNTFMNEIAELLGMKNVFDDLDGWAEISEEQVIDRNPDYIVTISMYYGDGLSPAEEIEQRSGWEDVSAVKNSAILNLENNELSRPTPRLVEGAQALFDLAAKN